PVLEAFPELAGEFRREDATERSCPFCGGSPQLAVFGETDEALVTPQRKLHCSRCATSWTFPRMTCAFCGETETSRLTVLADVEPHRLQGLRGRVQGVEPARGQQATVPR